MAPGPRSYQKPNVSFSCTRPFPRRHVLMTQITILTLIKAVNQKKGTHYLARQKIKGLINLSLSKFLEYLHRMIRLESRGYHMHKMARESVLLSTLGIASRLERAAT